MIMPTGVWLTIVSYRDFYDVPRLMLAADPESRYWILDSSFDDEQDEYSAAYSVYFAGRQLEQANAAFDFHAKGDKREVRGTVPITHLKFDPTKRLQFVLQPTSPRFQ